MAEFSYRKNFLQVPGGSIYFEARTGLNESVVFLHPAVADSRIWDREFLNNEGDLALIRADTRGLGKSTKASADFRPSDDLRMLLDHLNIKKTSLVAASNSGMAALDFAYRFPERVNRIMLLASGLELFDPEAESSLNETVQDFTANFQQIEELWKKGNKDSCVELLMNLFGSCQKGGSRELVMRMMVDNLTEIVTDESSSYQRYEITAEHLGEITAPTLILAGTEDHSLFGWATDMLSKSIKGSRKVVIEGADHLINLSAPEAFDGQFREFIVFQGK